MKYKKLKKNKQTNKKRKVDHYTAIITKNIYK